MDSSSAPAARARVSDRIVLGISAFGVALSVVLGQLTRAGGHPLPKQSFCWSQILLHRACAGCGLTRSFVALGAGDLAGAIRFNWAGPLLFGCLLLLMGSRLFRIARPARELRRFDLALGAAVALILVVRGIAFYFA
ncbi:MAG: DUF2752 domain-containing protein [Thermoanaerobaculia bacterium]